MSVADPAAQQRTRAFARVLGPYVAVFTATYAVRLPELKDIATGLMNDPTMILMLGAAMLAAGLVIIGLHRSWRGPIAVIISLFGWFIGLRGLLLIANPESIRSGVDATMDSAGAILAARLFFAGLAALGLLLSYAGWIGPRRRVATSDGHRPS